MKRYMVIGLGDGEQWARFFDSYTEAEQYRMDGSVSLGYVMQVYELTPVVIDGLEVSNEYVFIYE